MLFTCIFLYAYNIMEVSYVALVLMHVHLITFYFGLSML